MQQNPKDKSFLTATPLMYKYFQNTFDMLAARSPFDPKYFRYKSLQSIIHDNLYKENELNDEQRTLTGNFIKDYNGRDIATVRQKRISNEMKERYKLEQKLVSEIYRTYRKLLKK